MAVSTEIRQKAIALLEQLPNESLKKAVECLEVLSQDALKEKNVQNSKSNEIALLQMIQSRLSAEEQTRLDYLRQQNETAEITDQEHQELLNYVDHIEQQDAKRAEALIQLAQIRQVDLTVVINEFLPSHSPTV